MALCLNLHKYVEIIHLCKVHLLYKELKVNYTEEKKIEDEYIFSIFNECLVDEVGNEL